MGICSFDKNDLKEKNLHHQPNMMQSRAQDKSFQKKKNCGGIGIKEMTCWFYYAWGNDCKILFPP